MNNSQFGYSRTSSRSANSARMSQREKDKEAAELNNLIRSLDPKNNPKVKQETIAEYEERLDREHQQEQRKKQEEKDREYYNSMSMTQGYEGMKEGLEYQLGDARIRENNSWFIDESKEVNPYKKRDDADYLRMMDKRFLDDQKDYYQNVSLAYRFPITYMLVTAGLVFIGIPVLLFFLGMIFLF